MNSMKFVIQKIGDCIECIIITFFNKDHIPLK